jgi:predicted metal-dependent hydrolase
MPTYKDIDYTLVRSQRKTASIVVERDGHVTVRAPDELDIEQIQTVLEKKRYWIYKNQAEWADLNAAHVAREYVNGESFLYLGRHYRLKWVSEQNVPLKLKGGYFLLRKDAKTQQAPQEVFKTYYREKGRGTIPERVIRYAGQLGVTVGDVRVMELQNRWASCSAQGNLNFHWKCMLAPIKILDYIVVHELAHLLVPDHSPAFWNEVDKLMPDYRERQEWLRRHGAGLDV